jgi:hypothetical protein
MDYQVEIDATEQAPEYIEINGVKHEVVEITTLEMRDEGKRAFVAGMPLDEPSVQA